MGLPTGYRFFTLTMALAIAGKHELPQVTDGYHESYRLMQALTFFRVWVRVSFQCYLEVGYDRFATTITIKTIKLCVLTGWLN